MIRAKYIGAEGSLNYKYNKNYELQVNFGYYNGKQVLWILYPERCPYSSLESFLDNWKVIEWY